MLKEMAQATGAQTWVIVAMLFFIAVFAVALVRVLRKSREHMDHMARLPLDLTDEAADTPANAEVVDG